MTKTLTALLIPMLFFTTAIGAEKKEATVAALGLSITVGQLIRIGESGALPKLASQDFPALAAFRLNRLIAVATPEITRALKAKAALFTEANSTLVPGVAGVRTIKADQMDAFQKTLEPLLNEKVTLSVAPLSLEGDLAGAKLSARDIDDLGPLLKTD